MTIKAIAAKEGVTSSVASAEYIIVPAVPVVETIPAASAITYGQTLAYSTLTGGVAKWENKTVAGTFAWKNTAVSPVVSESEKTEYVAVFTPEDTDSYETVECKVKLTVNKADPAVTAPTANTLTYSQHAYLQRF